MKQDETGKWVYSAAEVVDYLKSKWNESLLRNEIQSAAFGTEENVDDVPFALIEETNERANKSTSYVLHIIIA
jgi:hypothetical protein